MNFQPAYRRDVKVNEANIDKDDLRRLFDLVQSQLKKAVTLQIANLNPDLFDNGEKLKQDIARMSIISYQINKRAGDSISGYNTPNVYSSSSPEQIDSIFLSTKNVFQAHFQILPRDTLEIFLDFRRSKLSIDFLTLPSNPTHNESVANISGLDEAWVIETYDKVKEFFAARKNKRSYLHGSGVYDIFLYAVVIPLFLYTFYRFEVNHPEFIDTIPKITIIAIYVYSLLFISLVGRLLFQYARWLFPLVEYKSDRTWTASAQRATLIAIVLGVIGTAIYDAIKLLL